MKKSKLLLAAICVSFLFISCNNSESTEDTNSSTEISEEEEVVENNEVQQIAEDLDNATFQKYLDEKGGLLIDVRTPEEVENGSIEGAVNINFTNGDFETAVDTLDKSVPTFVYCQSGGRSGKAKDLLIENGFLEVYNLENGYGNWEK
ncbi:MAG: rhodanese-like domain-containing protein [Crocinitomicaceae bacterium]|nr:rhodanese-like domain-containing protein [Crocinitomicaceae bacterium]